MEVKTRRLSSPLFSVCALKKGIVIHEIYQRLLRRRAFYEEKTGMLTVGIRTLLTCDRDLQENLCWIPVKNFETKTYIPQIQSNRNVRYDRSYEMAFLIFKHINFKIKIFTINQLKMFPLNEGFPEAAIKLGKKPHQIFPWDCPRKEIYQLIISLCSCTSSVSCCPSLHVQILDSVSQNHWMSMWKWAVAQCQECFKM